MFTELPREEKKEEGDKCGQDDKGRSDMKVTTRRKGGIKSSKSKLASNYVPMCSPKSATLREVHGVTQRREEGRWRQR